VSPYLWLGVGLAAFGALLLAVSKPLSAWDYGKDLNETAPRLVERNQRLGRVIGSVIVCAGIALAIAGAAGLGA
jgi:hypothetical protein